MKEILIGGKCDSWRHKVFLHGSCEEYPNQSKPQLINFDKFVGFSNDQIKMMISFLQRITEDHDYALQVLLPELIELLFLKKLNNSYHSIHVIHIMEEPCPTFKASGKAKACYYLLLL